MALPSTDLIQGYKDKIYRNNNNTIMRAASEIGKGTFFMNNYLTSSHRPWFYDFNIPRREIVTINRLRSGHSSLKNSLHKLGIVDNDICDCGSSSENIEHITFHCNQYSNARNMLFLNIRKRKLPIPNSIETILVLRNKDLLKCFLQFIANIGLQI